MHYEKKFFLSLLLILPFTGCEYEQKIGTKDSNGNIINESVYRDGTLETTPVTETEAIEYQTFDSKEAWISYWSQDTDNHLVLEGQNTLLFISSLLPEKRTADQNATITPIAIKNECYQTVVSDFWTIEDIYIVIRCMNDYYMVYSQPNTDTVISDNLPNDFQKLEMTDAPPYSLKYISCPIEDYEFYINDTRLYLGMTYE